ncbi:3'-5' exonuclease [Undibacterium flavidum]|uniref:3'-5' exonuclease domain-containing protein 2 n=1 Tax=Undibacterium flavidum TaxID=2762297 RepID=A0ABR6Y7G7_9BURK|nr:3'-5' exonuclease [Undibacterium flavidum]MBC3872560.1 3'-5' exonuclease domain-containing protein 2 [Undibacterium flavidum]
MSSAIKQEHFEHTGSDTELVRDLPAYPGIAPDRIILVNTAQDLRLAHQHLMQAKTLGYDTESKPVFTVGHSSDGPHLIQLATESHAFLFPLVKAEQRALSHALLKEVLESNQIRKVGFGLSDDNQMLMKKLAIKITNVLDLSRSLSDNRKKQMGAKRAVEKYFAQVLQKSKRVSTSNWAAEHLNDKQLKYAADDAQSALLVYLAASKLTE